MVKIGVFGARRGKSLLGLTKHISDCKIVAVCNNAGDVLTEFEDSVKRYTSECVSYTDFDKFLEHDMDLIILANYAHQHAPYAIKALKAGKHVLSETMAVVTLKEAVELIEAVEESGKEYALLDQTCFTDTYEYFKTLVSPEEILMCETEDSYNSTPLRKLRNQTGNPNYWKNHVASTTYTTHVLGRAMNFLNAHPRTVSAIEYGYCPEHESIGKIGAPVSEMTLKFDDGVLIKHKRASGTCAPKVVSQSIFTLKDGRRFLVDNKKVVEYNGDTETTLYERNTPIAQAFESQIKCISLMIDKILKKENDYSALHDVYEAVDISTAGILGFKSITQGNIDINIPDLRDKSVRDQYRNDTFCTFPDVGGDMYVPADYMRKKEAKD